LSAVLLTDEDYSLYLYLSTHSPQVVPWPLETLNGNTVTKWTKFKRSRINHFTRSSISV